MSVSDSPISTTPVSALVDDIAFTLADAFIDSDEFFSPIIFEEINRGSSIFISGNKKGKRKEENNNDDEDFEEEDTNLEEAVIAPIDPTFMNEIASIMMDGMNNNREWSDDKKKSISLFLLGEAR